MQKDSSRRVKRSLFAKLNPLQPLKIFYPSGPGSTWILRRNLVAIAALEFITSDAASGSGSVLLIYVNYEFSWGVFQSSRHMTIVNGFRLLFLVTVLSFVTFLLRKRRKSTLRARHGMNPCDLNMIRIAVAFDTSGYVGYGLARRGGWFTAAGVLSAAGGLSLPSLRSALTDHVRDDQVGQIMGAGAVLHALALVIAPNVLNGLLSAKVGFFPQTVLVF